MHSVLFVRPSAPEDSNIQHEHIKNVNTNLEKRLGQVWFSFIDKFTKSARAHSVGLPHWIQDEELKALHLSLTLRCFSRWNTKIQVIIQDDMVLRVKPNDLLNKL